MSALAAWLSVALLSTGAAPCPWQSDYVSATAKPLPPAEFEDIDRRWSIGEVLLVLGPAVRDVGSGLHVLEWDVDDGRIFRVSAADACGKPHFVGFVDRPPLPKEPK
jgi:hypothetical protein